MVHSLAMSSVLLLGLVLACARMVKILECGEGPRFSMMDIEDEHNHMRAAFGLRYRIGQPGTAAAE